MGFLKDWRDTRKFKIGCPLTQEEFNKLSHVVSRSQQIKKVLKTIWIAIMGICTILAAVFSILACFH